MLLLVLGQLFVPFFSAGTARGDRAGNPDLTLTSDDIVFSKDKPLKGDTVLINATVWNLGSANASSVRVRFYDGAPAGGKTIGSDQIIDSVPFNGSAVARVNWTDTSVNGTHYIYVVVDPADAISEDNENNNTANRSIFVNLPPSAVLNAASTTDYTNSQLSFNATGSSDPDGSITTCFWDFDDGNTTKGWVVSHSWSDDGVYKVTLLVSDDDGGTDTEDRSVTILNQKPLATAYDQTVYTLDTVTLDSANSTDNDGYIAGAKWTLHNGTVLTGKKVTTIYPQDGIYPLSLTVTDDDGDDDSTTLYITVLNRDPVPKINASSTHINASESVTFDAYKSYDMDGYLTNYTWIFQGGAKEYGVKTTHKFGSENGSQSVTLVVVDDDGAVSSASTTIRVGNQRPVAVAGLDTVVSTYENATFDATKSYDPDGTIINYTWDWGDGGLSNSAVDIHSYTKDGTFTVTLYVTDNDGATTKDSLNVSVLNQPPYAFFPDTLTKTYQNTTIDGSYCRDNDGYLVNFTWDLGDGVLLFGPEVTHIWTQKATYECRLTVRDDDGAEATCYFNVTVQDTAPKAAFGFSPSTPTELQDVTFDAAASSDIDGTITNYNWNFGDGNFGNGVLVTHAYLANGTYRVTLLVTDNDGSTDTVAQNITVAKYNAPPVAVFGYSPEYPTSTDDIEFDASASYDLAPGFIRRYEWDWGDGNTSTVSLSRSSHRFYTPGNFIVTLTVIDDMGAKGTASKEFVIAPGVNHPPIAVIFASARTQESGKPLSLDGSASYDTDGSIVGYLWDFGDGSQASFSIVSHVFTTLQNVSRDFTVTLTVTDDQGLSSNASLTITITPTVPPNQRPKAVLTASPTTTQTNQPVSLRAVGSYDPDGNIPEDAYSWSLGDGELRSGIEVYHRYLKPGIYVVLLTVKDNRGATGSATETIYVMNIPPKAWAGQDTGTITMEKVWFSGAASSDQDGEIVQYNWDFGDGTQAGGPLVSHTYQHSGVYLVHLTVRDDSGATSSALINVTVDNRAPVAALVGSNASAYTSDLLMFDGSRSSDPDGRIVTYYWDFGDGTNGTGSLASHAFFLPGTYTVKLIVTDDSGATSQENMTVSILKRTVVAEPSPAPAKGFIPGFEVVAVAATLAVVAICISRRRR